MEFVWNELGPPPFCITLKGRHDRLEHMTHFSREYEIPLQFVHVEKHPLGGQIGCYQSHLKVMKMSLELHPDDNCIIFEDDACTTLSKEEMKTALCKVARFMKTDAVWDILYLGCFPDVLSNATIPAEFGMYNVVATQTHAYIIHNAFMKKFIHYPYERDPIDEVFRRTAKTFASIPTIFNQLPSASDISSLQSVSLCSFKDKVYAAVNQYIEMTSFPILYWLCMFSLLYIFYVVK